MTKHQKAAIAFLDQHNAKAAWLKHYGPVSRDAIRDDYRLARRFSRKFRAMESWNGGTRNSH